MSFEQTVDNLEIRYANVVTFVGTSNTMIDTTTGRIQTKGIQHNSNVITDVSGPHGRVAPTLKKYPEIVFDASKMDGNDSTNTYTQAGYTVTASTKMSTSYSPWRAFDDYLSGNDGWATLNRYNASSPGEAQSGLGATQFPAASGRYGEYVDLQLPHGIKVNNFIIKTRPTQSGSGAWMPEDSPGAGYLYGSNNGTAWTEIKAFSGLIYGGMTTNGGTQETVQVDSTTAYKYLRLQATHRAGQNGSDQFLAIGALEYYGYEEYTPAGDHSVDTTFMSRFNNPQLTGVQVLVDGATGQGTNQISGGPDPSGNQSTMTSPNKYWTLNGTLTSNLSVEANTFLEGDQPHAVSVWFNSSNLEANVSNTCVFSVSDQEHLNSENLDLQSNTWHNLTYAYQGEGGSRVTYLDGRKVAEDQAEDTFGEYPPFAMTGYSQGGYVVSASDEDTAYPLWRIFAGDSDYYVSSTSAFPGGVYTSGSTYNLGTNSGGSATDNGHWIKLAVPYKLKISHVNIDARTGYEPQAPKNFKFYGSNDDTNWEQIGPSFSNEAPQDDGTSYYTLNSTKAYKYVGLVVTETVGNGNGRLGLQQLKFYGHRENDLVRLPDPTNVLKYPHIAMTGPAQRGYVVSAKNFVAGREPWEAFNGYVYGTHPSTPNDNGWMSNGLEFIKSTGAYYQNGDTFTDTASGTHTGPWIRLETPHKLQLSSFDISNGNNAERRMKSIVILGSDDASASTGWSLIYTNTNITNAQDVNGLVVNSSQAFKYHMIVTKAVSGAPGQSGSTAVWVAELQLYGTGVDSVPIQIGGGNIDKVANFRVYDKFIDQNQALEIWDAQKDEFGRAKSSMTLQKGRLGIGTTEPQGRLAVLDEPHNLEEFPPRPMTDYKTYMEGHGEFCVSASDEHSSNYDVQNAFNKITNRLNSSGGTTNTYYNGGEPTPRYYDSGNDYAYSGTSSTHGLGGVMGEWVKLEFPYKANISQISILPVDIQISTLAPEDFTIMGSSDDINWTTLRTVTGATWTAHNFNEYTLPSTTSYKYFALVVSRTVGSNQLSIQELKYFGTREQGQSVLHDGQLTLTKSLNVPRIGPALDADDTPRRDRLVVEYNTSTNPTFEGAVRDTSGRGLDGVFTTGAGYGATEKALTFNGASTSGITVGGATGVGGDKPFSIGLWFKTSQNPVSTDVLTYIGGNETSRETVILTFSTTQIKTEFYGQSMGVNPSGGISVGTWYHVVATYPGGGHHNVNIHVNGVKLSQTNYGSSSTALIPENADIFIGKYFNTNNSGFNGSISQFKLYDCTLTAEEVKTLYDMGRMGNVANPQPLHIAAPLYAPGTIVQVQYASTPLNNTVKQSIVGGELSDASNDIDYLDMNFKPKFANSSILLNAMIVFSPGFVTSFGFKEDNTTVRTQGDNTNTPGGIFTYYDSTSLSNDRMKVANIQVMIPANGTHTRRYNAAAASSWGTTTYTLTINERGSNDMRSISNMVVYEIAN